MALRAFHAGASKLLLRQARWNSCVRWMALRRPSGYLRGEFGGDAADSRTSRRARVHGAYNRRRVSREVLALSNVNAESFDCDAVRVTRARRGHPASAAPATLRALCGTNRRLPSVCRLRGRRCPGLARRARSARSPRPRKAHAARALRSRRRTPAPLPRSPTRFRSIDCSSASSTVGGSRLRNGPARHSPPPCMTRARAGPAALGRIASWPCRSPRHASATAASTRRARSRRAWHAAPGCRSRRRWRGSRPGRRRRRCRGRSAPERARRLRRARPGGRRTHRPRRRRHDDRRHARRGVAHAAVRRRRAGRMLGRRAHAAALTTTPTPP